MPNVIMSAAEVAERLGVDIRTVGRWTEQGRLTALREPPRVYDGAEVEKLAAELAQELAAKLAHLVEQPTAAAS